MSPAEHDVLSRSEFPAYFEQLRGSRSLAVEDAVNDADSHGSVELDRREPEWGKAESEWGKLDWEKPNRGEPKVVHVATWTRRQS